jgi:SAM-dependent methyltransferase
MSHHDRTFTAGHGSSRIATYLSIARYHARGRDRLVRETAERARHVLALTHDQDDRRVLDLGCGGRAGVTLALHTMGVEVTGIDYDVVVPRPSLTGWIAIGRRNGFERAVKTAVRQVVLDRSFYRGLSTQLGRPLKWDELDVRSMDARALDFPDESFSFVWSAAVFEHIADVDAATREMHRVLRPGGAAFLRIHLFPSLSGGHALDWADPDEAPRPETPVPPWDHLRERRFPAHVYLNELSAADYMSAFRRHFQVDRETYRLEGAQYLTPALREELASWSVEDLTRRNLEVLLRKV